MERIIVFTKNLESAFWKKGMFCDGELRRSVRISHRSENFSFCCYATPIVTGSLHDPVTWYKTTYAHEQVVRWDLQNKDRSRWTGTSCIVLEVAHITTLLPIYKGCVLFDQNFQKFSSNRMKQKVSGNSFQKFWSTSRGCPIFWKFGNSWNFLLHLAFLPQYESTPVPLVVKSYSTLHWMQNDLP